jgi:hypothetical protein
VGLVVAKLFERQGVDPLASCVEVFPSRLEQAYLNCLTASKSTAAAGNERPAQSLARSSPSSISQSGLMSNALPANDDND